MSSLPTIAALDVATTTGVSFGRVGDKPQFLSKAFRSEATDFSGHVEALAQAQIWTIEFLNTVKPDFVVIEAPFEFTPEGGNPRTTIRLTMLAGGIAAIAKNKSYPVRFGKVSTVRRAFLGPGNGALKGDQGKREVMRFCRAAGWEPETLDQSDAGALWWWLGLQLCPQQAQPMDPISLRIPPVQSAPKSERVRLAPKRFGSAAQ